MLMCVPNCWQNKTLLFEHLHSVAGIFQKNVLLSHLSLLLICWPCTIVLYCLKIIKKCNICHLCSNSVNAYRGPLTSLPNMTKLLVQVWTTVTLQHYMQ